MFKHITRIKIRKHERYTGALFDEEDAEHDPERILDVIDSKTINPDVIYLDYEPNVIELNEIE